jgi:hypothetical protein
MPSAAFYRFAAPRTIFFTLRFFEPRAYSLGFSGFSVFTFLRAVRFDFLRSSLLSFFVFAMSAVYFSLRSPLLLSSRAKRGIGSSNSLLPPQN